MIEVVGRETAQEAVKLLSTALGEIAEHISVDGVLLAIVTHERGEDVRRLGADISTLGGAIVVLCRLSGSKVGGADG